MQKMRVVQSYGHQHIRNSLSVYNMVYFCSNSGTVDVLGAYMELTAGIFCNKKGHDIVMIMGNKVHERIDALGHYARKQDL